jgi:plasmid rolling circle replication initiator protein Rep
MTCKDYSNYREDDKEKKLLADYSRTGKKRNWRKYKLQSLAVSKAYGFFDELLKYGKKISECGSWLRFGVCQANNHFKRLIRASFCKGRLCVTCQWRKSLVIRKQLLELVHAHKEKFPSDIPLLLTLTIPNVKEEKLSSALDLMAKSWKKLSERKQFTSAVRSWFRALEVTYNEKREDFHPHFHILLMVPEAYFKIDRELYITQEVWLKLWREATGIEEITQVDIRKVKKRKKGTIEKLVAEVGKYATKPSTYIKREYGEFEAKQEVIRCIHYALYGRRLVGYGGLFSEIRKKLKQQDVEEADLINIDDGSLKDCFCPICKSTLIEEMYKWNIGIKNYEKRLKNEY